MDSPLFSLVPPASVLNDTLGALLLGGFARTMYVLSEICSIVCAELAKTIWRVLPTMLHVLPAVHKRRSHTQVLGKPFSASTYAVANDRGAGLGTAVSLPWSHEIGG